MGHAYGSSPRFENWDPSADLNNDGVINIYDLALASKDKTSGKKESFYTPLEGSTPTISVKPVNTTVLVGQNFSIDVNVTYALETYAWEFYLNWNSSLINVVEPNVTEGEFLNQDGNLSTYLSYFFNQTEGWVIVGCTLYEQPVTLPSGSGRLATIHFTTLDIGSSMLDLNDTKLLNDTLDNYTHESSDGSVDVVECLNDADCGFCEECSSLNSCSFATGTDPKGDCIGNCDVCNGAGSCTADQTLCIGNCDYCTGSGNNYNCAANETVCELMYCGDCTGSGTNFNCVYDETEDEDCDPFDIAGIATCDWNPDAYPYTWDNRTSFDSVCAGLDQCTQGNTTITHTCADNNLTDTVPLGGCGAECDENSDCVCDVCFSNCTCLILLADLNDDRGVNILDLIIVGNAFGSKPGDPRWNSTADIYGPGKVPDGLVNVYDLSLVGKKFGDEC